MARVSICDYCKKISKDDFEHFIELIDEGRSLGFEICEDCNGSLLALLSGEVEIPPATSLHPEALEIDGPMTCITTVPPYLQKLIQTNGQPTEALLDHELNSVPSRRDQVVDVDVGCAHKYDMQQDELGQMFMACTKCDEKMETESIS